MPSCRCQSFCRIKTFMYIDSICKMNTQQLQQLLLQELFCGCILGTATSNTFNENIIASSYSSVVDGRHLAFRSNVISFLLLDESAVEISASQSCPGGLKSNHCLSLFSSQSCPGGLVITVHHSFSNGSVPSFYT